MRCSRRLLPPSIFMTRSVMPCNARGAVIQGLHLLIQKLDHVRCLPPPSLPPAPSHQPCLPSRIARRMLHLPLHCESASSIVAALHIGDARLQTDELPPVAATLQQCWLFESAHCQRGASWKERQLRARTTPAPQSSGATPAFPVRCASSTPRHSASLVASLEQAGCRVRGAQEWLSTNVTCCQPCGLVFRCRHGWMYVSTSSR